MSPITTSQDLILKYNLPGPRYTSYPTAVQFTNEADLPALLADSEKEDGPISLYFHLPFCESLCWFCGCNTVITTDHSKADTYLDYLEKEIDLFVPRLRPGRRVVQMHFGGGTPNFLEPSRIRRLGDFILKNFQFDPEGEYSVELDPRWITRDHLIAFREMGVNRASFGVQDCNPEVQKAIHRIQPRELNERLLDWLRREQFTSINIDLIYGLPLQTVETFRETLDEILEYDPDRLAIFSYAHVPQLKPSQNILEKIGLPDPRIKMEILMMTIEKLTGAGYVFIGMDHFAKPDDELALAQQNKSLQRNFQGYSTRAGPEICAFGVSAISQTTRSYRQNHKVVSLYYEALERGELPIERGYRLSQDDHIRRETIMRLMCDLSLDFKLLSSRLDIDFRDYYAKELEEMRALEEDGLVQIGQDKLEVSELGRLLIRNVAMLFDTYVNSEPDRFSKTI